MGIKYLFHVPNLKDMHHKIKNYVHCQCPPDVKLLENIYNSCFGMKFYLLGYIISLSFRLLCFCKSHCQILMAYIVSLKCIRN